MSRQVIIEVDERMFADLERVAPAGGRQRSRFIRTALRRVLDEHAEALMAEAYRRQPDLEPVYFDARAWEPSMRSAGSAKAGRRRR